MTTQQSAVALRVLIVGEVGYPSVTDPSNSLAGLNTAELPDGASAFVVATGAVYRLHKASTQAGIGNSVFVPPSGGPGCWFYESGGDSLFNFQETGTASLTGAQVMTVNQWAQLPSGSGFYQTSSSGTPFSQSSTSGVVTYTGPNKRFRVRATATLSCATAAQALELAITQNDFLIGTTTFDGTAGAASADPTTANLGITVVTEKVVILANNDAVRPVMRNTTATPGNTNATHLNLVISPA